MTAASNRSARLAISKIQVEYKKILKKLSRRPVGGAFAKKMVGKDELAI